MCGLVGVWSKKGRPVKDRVIDLFTRQKKRGTDGFGYLAIHKGKLVNIGRAKTEAGIKSLLNKENAEIILFHHRFPTSTANTLGTTHPIKVENDELEYDYYFAHNGVISNHTLLKGVHEKLGYIYHTEHTEVESVRYTDGRVELLEDKKVKYLDSEALAIELARFCDDKADEIDARGAVAFWGIRLIKGTDIVDKIYFGKNMGRDLKTEKKRKFFSISSETGADLEDMQMFSWNMEENQLYKEDLPIDKAAPVIAKTVGFHNNPDYISGAEYALENKPYKWIEMRETGVPDDRFDWSTERGGYIPKRFLLPVKKEYQYSDTIKNLAEDYCEKIAILKADIEDLEESYRTGRMTLNTYGIKEDKKLQKIDTIEEKLYMLGLEEEYIEELLETAVEMEGYNRTYGINNLMIT